MWGQCLLYLSDPIVFHLNHVEGVVGPASFLVKLNIARQSLKTDLKYTNINEDSNLVSFSCSGDSEGRGRRVLSAVITLSSMQGRRHICLKLGFL